MVRGRGCGGEGEDVVRGRRGCGKGKERVW